VNSNAFERSLIRGFNWKARMFNGAVFEFWTPKVISRKKARKEILKIANGDFDKAYVKEDIEQLWFNKNIKQ